MTIEEFGGALNVIGRDACLIVRVDRLKKIIKGCNDAQVIVIDLKHRDNLFDGVDGATYSIY